jgi:hypothetical protein
MYSTPQKIKSIGAGATVGNTYKHINVLIGGQVADGLALITCSAEAWTDSPKLAKSLGNKQKNLIKLRKPYCINFERLGFLRLQTAPPAAGRLKKFEIMNGDQSMQALTYKSNISCIRRLQVRLIQLFFDVKYIANIPLASATDQFFATSSIYIGKFEAAAVMESRRVLENTVDNAETYPTARFLYVQNLEVWGIPAFMVSGGMGLPARLAAWRYPCFQHPVHPLLLKRQRVVCSLITEPKS